MKIIKGKMKKLQHFKIAYLRNFFVISFFILMIVSSLNQIKNELFIISSLWKNHGEKILKGDIDKTYAGFENFDYFLWWCDEKIPKSENVAILYPRGTIYIYPRTSYVLYPRDVITIKTEEKKLEEIYKEIFYISNISDKPVNYLIVLKPSGSLKDLEDNLENLKIIGKYTDKAGFIYEVSD